MNSTPIQSNNLLDEGAYVGNIMDFINETEYNEMLLVIEKVKEYFVVNRDTELHCRYVINGDGDSYEHKIPLGEVSSRDEYVKENNLTVFQKWYEYSIKTNSGEIECFDFFKNFCKRILDYFYPEYEINYDARTGGFTLYEDGHFIQDHKDGNNVGRVCVVIMYLSSELEYNDDGGGELVIRTNSEKEYTIKPILGTFSLLDFTKNNNYHQVNEVKNGFKRYAFINFLNENDLKK